MDDEDAEEDDRRNARDDEPISRPFDDSYLDDHDRKALDFHDTDPTYRVFICHYPIAPVFFLISILKIVLALSALAFTVAQLISRARTSDTTDEKAGKSITNATTTQRSPDFPNWISGIFYFEPPWWAALAYVRLAVSSASIIGGIFGLYGLYKRRRRPHIYFSACVDLCAVVFLLCYLAVLAYHAVKHDDYFAFCIGGITLFSLLLLNVVAIHVAVRFMKYLRSVDAFLNAIRRRWPAVYEEAAETVSRWNILHRHGPWTALCTSLTRRYALVSELSRVRTAEMQTIRCGGRADFVQARVLHDIHEEDSDETQFSR